MEDVVRQESLEEKVVRLEKENQEKDEKIAIFEESIRLLIEEQKTLVIKAYYDGLTRLRNIHGLEKDIDQIFKRKDEEKAHEERKKSKEGQEDNICVIMVDIDKFKLVNDKYGHLNGDKILREVSDRLSESIRDTDVIARCGGEEIIILLVGASEYEAGKKAERLRKLIEKTPFNLRESGQIDLTVSIGVTFGDNNSDPEKLRKEADDALYQAKEGGRNRVEIYKNNNE